MVKTQNIVKTREFCVGQLATMHRHCFGDQTEGKEK